MNRESIHNILGLAGAVIVAVAMYIFLKLPGREITALIVAVLSFLLYRYLMFTYDDKNTYLILQFPSQILNIKNFVLQKKDVIFAASYVVSIIAVVVIPQNASIYLIWGEIPCISWLRLAAAILLTIFFPGYTLWRLISRKTSNLGILLPLIVSYFFGMILYPLASFVLSLSGFRIDQQGILVFAIFNSTLVALFLISSLVSKSEIREIAMNNKIDLNRILGSAILFCLFILFIYALYLVHFTFDSFLRGDMWRHFAAVQKFLNHGFSHSFKNEALSWNYPPWFHLYLASFFVLSGFPSVNSYVLINFLALFYIPTFFLFASAFLGGKNLKIPIIATVIWLLFSGFDWVFIISYIGETMTPDIWLQTLREWGLRSFSGIIQPNGWKLWGFTPYIALQISIMMLYLIWSKKIEGSLRYFLILLFTILNYLLHIKEMAAFTIVFLPLLVILHKKDSMRDVSLICLSVLLGLLLVLPFDLLTGRNVYIGSYLFEIVAFTAAVLCVALIRERINIGKIHIKTLGTLPYRLSTVGLFAICYVFGLSLIICYYIIPRFPSIYIIDGSDMVAWYHFPWRLGAAGILLLIAIGFLVFGKRKSSFAIKFSLVMILWLLIFGVGLDALNYFSFYTLHLGFTEEMLFLMYWPLSVAILAGWGIIEFFSNYGYSSVSSSRRKSLRKSFVLGLCLSLIVTTGTLSSILSTEVWRLGSGPWAAHSTIPSSKDIEMLNFLKNHNPTDSWVIQGELTGLERIPEKIILTGSYALYSTDIWFGMTRPETIFAIRSLLNAKYQCMYQHDLQGLKKRFARGYVARHLLKYLPLVLDNTENLIFEIPSFMPPTDSSFAVIVSKSFCADEDYFPLEMVALSNRRYQVYLDTDENCYNSATILLPYDGLGSFIDDFSEYAVGSCGSPTWRIERGNWSIIRALQTNGMMGNVYHGYGRSATEIAGYRFVNGTISLDAYIESGYEVRILLRFNDWSSYYGIYIGSENGVRLVKVYGKKSTQVTLNQNKGITISNGVWYNVRVVANGPSLEVYVNDELAVSGIDSSLLFSKENTRMLFWSADSSCFYDNIVVTPESYRNIARDIEWIKEGGRLIVINSYIHSHFADLLSIEVDRSVTVDSIEGNEGSISFPEINVNKTHLEDKEVRVIANYTRNGQVQSPFVYEKNIGNGKLIYVELSGYFAAMTSDDFSSSYTQLFSKMREMIGMLGLSLPRYIEPQEYSIVSPARTQIMIRETINMIGVVEIRSDSILPQSTLNASQIIISAKNGSSFTISNVTINELRTERTSSLITTSKAQITSSNLGTYSLLTFRDGLRWVLRSEDAGISLSVNRDDSTFDLTTHDGDTVTIVIPSNIGVYAILAKQPEVSVEGQTDFVSHTWFEWYKKGDFVLDYSIAGDTKFRIPVSDYDSIFLSNLTTTGKTGYYTTKQMWMLDMVPALYKIPWFEVFTSPYHLILVFGMIELLRHYYNRPRTRKDR